MDSRRAISYLRDRWNGRLPRGTAGVEYARRAGELVRHGYERLRFGLGIVAHRDDAGDFWNALREAIEQSRRELVEMTAVASSYDLLVHPSVWDHIETGGWRRDLVQTLHGSAETWIRQRGYQLLDRPLTVRLRESEEVSPNGIQVLYGYEPRGVRPCLETVRGAVPERSTFLTELPFTIGRSLDNSLVVGQSSSTVSGHHAVIVEENGDYWLIDEGSLNGTWAADVSLAPRTPQKLRAGDRIQLGAGSGAVELEFQLR